MQLHDLLDATEVLEIIDDAPVRVLDVIHDSRAASPGSLFCCIRGGRTDGHDHARAAVAAGAVALLAERRVTDLDRPVPQVIVGSVRAAVGPVAARAAGDPSRQVPVFGVTGTNGKTTTVTMLAAILAAAGRRPAVVGTLGVHFGSDVVATGFTTPEAPELQRTLADLVARGADAVTMEVSSHALAHRRVDGTHLAGAGFTNLSPEHLDEHGSMDAYLAAKTRLFTGGFTDRATVCIDDAAGRDVAAAARAAGLTVRTVALDSADADVTAHDVVVAATGTTAVVDGLDGSLDVSVPLAGRFNLANALVAVGMAAQWGVSPDALVHGLAGVAVVPGRFERVVSAAPVTVIVDYAHTPAGIAAALRAARELTGGRVLAVFGCGGDRDAGKRPEMGAAAGALADAVVLTSDNPRSEDPAAIAAAAATGLDRVGASYSVELDRRAAIAAAIGAARPGDVVMVLGKGAETGQIVGTERRPFDDRVVAADLLEAACA